MLKQALLAIVTTAALVAADTKPADATPVVAKDAPVVATDATSAAAAPVVAADTKPADATPVVAADATPAAPTADKKKK